METSPQKHTPPSIRPIKYRQSKAVKEQNIAKYRVYHPKNLRTIHPPDYQDQARRYIKNSAKILQTQDVISSARYSLKRKTVFQNAFFSSSLRSISTSVSSFELKAWYQMDEIASKTIFKSLSSLKNLHNFDIQFHFFQFPAKSDLHSLFKRLLYLKKLNHFSLQTLYCSGFETQHLNALFSVHLLFDHLNYNPCT